jgi:2-oxoglutarate/2-oxoacid ferredoxin oxidoreductase subunit alpha
MKAVIKIAGEQGMGIESTGFIVMNALKNLGFWVYGEREFNSLIKGGKSSIQITASPNKVRSMSQFSKIGVGVDREGVLDLVESLENGGVLIHGFDRWSKVIKNLPSIAEEKNLSLISIPAREIALENGGNIVMINVVLLGFLWQVLGLELETLKQQISNQFSKKPELININQNCAQAGFDFQPENIDIQLLKQKFSLEASFKDLILDKNRILIDGNSAIGLGAIKAGVRVYYAYPMSPSTSILSYLAKTAKKTGILVKQLEDEISVAQATLGSSYAGTRSMCGTSGGGFDLMTETVSLAGMVETPWVCVIAQRPGPATGLPTWTGQADLNIAIYGGHGEFARLVVGCSDPSDCYTLVPTVHNLAEKYQLPAVILTEASIGMSSFSEEKFSESTSKIERYLSIEKNNLENSDLKVNFNLEQIETQNFDIVDKLESTDRYKITENGISKRWIPGGSETIYFANGDEHLEDGSLTEEAENSKAMFHKRNLKSQTLLADLPEPEIYSNKNLKTGLNENKIGIVGWGSTKNVVLDALDILSDYSIDYLHYTYLWPLKTEKFVEFAKNHTHLLLIENNYTGQLGGLLEAKTGFKFTHKFLKFDGRSIYVEEIIKEIGFILSKNLN